MQRAGVGEREREKENWNCGKRKTDNKQEKFFNFFSILDHRLSLFPPSTIPPLLSFHPWLCPPPPFPPNTNTPCPTCHPSTPWPWPTVHSAVSSSLMPPFGDLHGNSHEPCTTNVGASESVGLHCRREYRHVDAANMLQKTSPANDACASGPASDRLMPRRVMAMKWPREVMESTSMARWR